MNNYNVRNEGSYFAFYMAANVLSVQVNVNNLFSLMSADNLPEYITSTFYHSFGMAAGNHSLSLGAQFGYPEASMAALTEDEHKRLGNAENKYLPEIARLGGPAAVIDLIKETLNEKLNEKSSNGSPVSPVTLDLADGSVIALPLSFDDFRRLALEKKTHERALESYYQHPLHTAYRYLSKPNR